MDLRYHIQNRYHIRLKLYVSLRLICGVNFWFKIYLLGVKLTRSCLYSRNIVVLFGCSANLSIYTGCLRKNAMEIQQAVVHNKRIAKQFNFYLGRNMIPFLNRNDKLSSF